MRHITATRDAHKTHRKQRHVGPWFRGYASDIDDSRLQLLPVDIKWRWYELSCLASLSNGELPDPRQIAFRLRCALHDVECIICELLKAGLLEQQFVPGQRSQLRMQGWSNRQFVTDRSAPRMARLRDRKKQRDGGVTSHVTENVTEMLSSPSPSETLSTKEVAQQVEVGLYQTGVGLSDNYGGDGYEIFGHDGVVSS